MPSCFTTTEATSTEGHAVEYQFTYTSFGVLYETAWSTELSGDIIFANAGQYRVYAGARCIAHPDAIGRASVGSFIAISAP